MLNSKGERELCYVVKIDEVKPIEGRDRVECAVVGGWTCMVPKGAFQPGSLGIYFEIDSKVDYAKEVFNFTSKYGGKIKTQKFKTPSGQFWSQGLLMSPSDFGWSSILNEEITSGNCVVDSKNGKHYLNDESKFLTKQLGVTYAEIEDNKRKSNGDPNAKYKAMAGRHPKLFQNRIVKWLYKKNWGKKFLYIFLGKKKDKKKDWPAWVKKTDEERVQNIPWILNDKSEWIATEKIDGTSTTFSMRRRGRKFDFYICSRNVVFDKPDKKCFYETNVYTEMAEKYNIENVLKDFLLKSPKNVEWVTLQGETYGKGVQKRTYGLENVDQKDQHAFMGFNLIDSISGRWNSVDSFNLMIKYGVPWVPILDTHYILPDSVDELITNVTGNSTLDGKLREGIVFRSKDGTRSFKAVSNEYLLKYHG